MENKENNKILLVDDETDILDVLRFNFTASGYQVTAVTSAEEALALDLSAFGLIILDLMLGGMSGARFTMLLKENPLTAEIPIIMLTAKNAREDIIDGLRLGVDDYVSKPFSVQELLLRSQAVLRRARRSAFREDPAEGKTLSLDLRGKSLSIEGRRVSLTRTEFGILQLLMEHPGRVFSRDQLLDKAWPEGVVVTDRSVDVSITRLRKKLGPYAKCIVTRPGHGYCFTDEDIEV
ncbi:MAG: response regulator transcription factor [Bacteroidales bacterium]|nr:response regulator transcription factor [Bacteroidales bacterium]